MKHYFVLACETAVMVGGLLLVIITLSGQTQDYAIGISVASVIFYVLSQLFPPKEDK